MGVGWRIAAGQGGVVTVEQCRNAGITEAQVRKLCRDRRWVRLNEGVYFVDGANGGDPPRPAIIRAAMLSAGPHAVAVLDTAAELHGIAGTGRTQNVHVSLPGPHARPRRYTDPTVRLHQLVLRPEQRTVVNGLQVTTPVRTVADLIVRTDRFVAVAVLDSALNRRIVLDDELDLVRGLINGRRGAVRARLWIAQADARAESPLETRVRLRAADADLAPDQLQYRIRDASGNVVAIGDLAWLCGHNRVIGEADGAEAHDNPTAVFRDRTRQNRIIAAGYVPIRFTWRDTQDPHTIPRTIHQALYPPQDPRDHEVTVPKRPRS